MAGLDVIIKDGTTYQMMPASTAGQFSTTTAYAVGDFVYFDGVLYKCTTAHTGAFVASHFTAVTVGAELKQTGADLQSEINDVKSDLSDLEEEIKEHGGLSDEAKTALLECFRHTAFLDHDKDYYSALKNALHPDDIASLVATFNQDGYMFSPTDELDDLLPFLTVKAQYNDGTEEIITDYSLSGSLDYAISTITVAYLGKTTTFNVTVKQLPSGYTRKTYIESDRSQYISTNISEVEAGGYSYKLKAMPSDSTPTARLVMHVFSSLNCYTTVFRHGVSSTSEPEPNRYIASNRWGSESVPSENKNVWSANTISTIKAYLNGDDNVYVDNTLAVTCQIGTTKDASNKMFLLGYSGAPTRSDFRYAGRIYSFKMYAIGTSTKTHDFVPCVNSQSVAGIYDLVTDEFLSPTVGTLVTD